MSIGLRPNILVVLTNSLERKTFVKLGNIGTDIASIAIVIIHQALSVFKIHHAEQCHNLGEIFITNLLFIFGLGSIIEVSGKIELMSDHYEK